MSILITGTEYHTTDMKFRWPDAVLLLTAILIMVIGAFVLLG